MSSVTSMDKNYVLFSQLKSKLSDRHVVIGEIKAFLKSGFDVNYVFSSDSKVHQGYANYTALHLVAESDCSKRDSIVKLLLKLGADFTKKNRDGYTALRLAFEKYKGTKIAGIRKSLIDTLLMAHLWTNDATNPHCKSGITHLHIACISNNVKVVKFFLESGVPVNKAIKKNSSDFPGCTPLHLAMKNEDKNMIQLLLEHGADPTRLNANKMSSLHLIIEKQISDSSYKGMEKVRDRKLLINGSILDLVLKSQQDNFNETADSTGLSLLHMYCTRIKSFKAEEWEKLLKNAVNLDAAVHSDSPMWAGFTFLHFAAHCNLKTVTLLLEKGANFMAKDANAVAPIEICLWQDTDTLEPCLLSKIKSTLKSIKLQNGKTLADAIAALDKEKKMRKYLKTASINDAIPLDSPLWPGLTLLHVSVLLSQGSNTSKVSLCLKHGADITIRDSDNMTALHRAFYMKNKRCISEILVAHEDVADNPVDDKNVSHFHIACSVNHTKVVKMFLSERENPDVQTGADASLKCAVTTSKEHASIPASSTPLHVAVAIGSPGLAKLLLEHGADPHISDADGFTWLHRAFLNPKFKKFKSLIWEQKRILKKNPVAPGGLSHLHVFCAAGDTESIKALLLHASNMNEPINDALIKYVKDLPNHIGLGDTPLHLLARRHFQESSVDLFLSKGADFEIANEKGLTPLHEALMVSDNSDTIRRFVKEFDQHQKWPDKVGLTKLHVACALNDASLTKKLLKDGQDVNSQINRDSQLWPGATPLHILLINNDYPKNDETVKLLLNHVLESIEDSIAADQPLHGSAKRRKVSTPKSKNRGIVANVDGFSAFHVSCMGSDSDIVERFIKTGIDINVPKDYLASKEAGYTGLHFAVEVGSKSVLETLLKHGADVTVEDVKGYTPMILSVTNSWKGENIVSYLEKTPIFLKICEVNVGAKNTFGLTVFHFLLLRGDVGSDLYLDFLKNSTGIEKIDKDIKMKLLRKMAFTFSVSTFKLSIEHVPKLNFLDAKGRNIIHNIFGYDGSNDNYHYYSYDNHEDFIHNVNLLLENGCELDYQDKEGRTPLHRAVLKSDFSEAAEILLLGPDINITDNYGETPYTSLFNDKVWLDGAIVDEFHDHLDRLDAAGLHINRLNTECSKKYMSLSYKSTFLEYLKKMEKKVSSSISLRSLLTEEMVMKFPFMSIQRRQKVLECFECKTISIKFTYWLPIFKLQKRKMLNRVKQTEIAVDALRSLLLESRLPQHCLESILMHLNNEDWNNLILARKT